MAQKMIAVSPETYTKLKSLAQDDGRKIGKQVEFMVDFFTAHANASRLLFSSDPDIVSKVINSWLEESRQAMVERLWEIDKTDALTATVESITKDMLRG